jgi:hypothetical protein
VLDEVTLSVGETSVESSAVVEVGDDWTGIVTLNGVFEGERASVDVAGVSSLDVPARTVDSVSVGLTSVLGDDTTGELAVIATREDEDGSVVRCVLSSVQEVVVSVTMTAG